jgi:host factor-I protein
MLDNKALEDNTNLLVNTNIDSSDNNMNVQDQFLSKLCREQTAVCIYLVNGIKLSGSIKSFDQYVIYLDAPAAQIVYKHAVCSVMPATEYGNRR